MTSGRHPSAPLDPTRRRLLGLSALVLVALGAVVALGTLAAAADGVLAARRQFVDAWVAWVEVGGLALPLPGARPLLLALFVLLILSEVVWPTRPRRAGLLLTHAGVALLLLGSAIDGIAAREGVVRLQLGESAEAAGAPEVELVVIEELTSSAPREIAAVALGDLDGAAARLRAAAPRLPLTVEALDGGAVVGGSDPGLALQLQVAGGEAVQALLRVDGPPRVVEGGEGKLLAVRLRRVAMALPFRLTLARIDVEHHPGTATERAVRIEVELADRSEPGRRVAIGPNAPLWHGDYVVYQGDWGPRARDATPSWAELVVASRRADTLRIVAAVLLAVGLAWHFTARLTVTQP